MKNFWKKFLTLSMVVATITTCTVGLTACNNKGNGNDTAKVSPVEDASFVNIDINPNIDLVVDANNKVLSVVANNEDAEKLLIKADVKGKNVDEAVDSIIALSFEMEYINEENSDVKVLAVNASGSVNTALVDKICDNVQAAAVKAQSKVQEGLKIAVDTVKEASKSVERRLEKAKAELQAKGSKVEQEVIDSLNAAKLILIETIQELSNNTADMVELAKLSIVELNEMIYSLNQEVKVVVKGAVEEIAQMTANKITEVQEKIEAVYNSEEYKAFKIGGKYYGQKVMKNTYVAAANGISKFTQRINEASKAYTAYMKVAPKSAIGQNTLSKDVDDLADALFTEDAVALKTNFKEALKENVDGTMRYTYKSVAVGVDKFYDESEISINDSTVDGAKLAKALDKFDKDYADEVSKANEAGKVILGEIQSGFNKILLPAVIEGANAVNESFGLPELAKPDHQIITLNDYTIYVMDTISAQTKAVEAAFTEKVDDVLTAEDKALLDKYNGMINEAKANARKYVENKLAGIPNPLV